MYQHILVPIDGSETAALGLREVGSNAEYIVRHAPVPVLLIRSREA